jgi:GT2 family glycosyltransferase
MVKKQISLIIVTYESSGLIKDCLDSVFKFNDLSEELEIIVVDNGSKDQAVLFGFIQNTYTGSVKCVASPGNTGYGAGNNLGVRHASSDRIIIMNPDVRLVEPVFLQLISFFDMHPDTGMVSVSFADQSCPFFVKPEHYTIFNLMTFKCYVRKKQFDSRKMYLPGSFLMFDRAVFEQVGCFDEQIFLYFEEADIATRIEQAGLKVRRIDDLRVFHLTHDRKLNEQLLKIEIDSLAYYAAKFDFGVNKVLGYFLNVNRMKYWAAVLLRNRSKAAFFSTWIKLVKAKLHEINH